MFNYSTARCLTCHTNLYEDDHSSVEEIQLVTDLRDSKYIYYSKEVLKPVEALTSFPDWYKNDGVPILVYYSDEEIGTEIEAEECSMGWLLNFDRDEENDYPFEIYDIDRDNIKDYLSEELGESTYEYTDGWIYAVPVTREILVEESATTGYQAFTDNKDLEPFIDCWFREKADNGVRVKVKSYTNNDSGNAVYIDEEWHSLEDMFKFYMMSVDNVWKPVGKLQS